MLTKVILLSGPVGSGKSTLASSLVSRYKAVLFKTNELIRTHRPSVPNDRLALQRAGDLLDRKTGGKWIQEALAIRVQDVEPDRLIVVDSVRKLEQAQGIRDSFGSRLVHHIHLTASDEKLRERYAARRSEMTELPTYEELRQNRTEKKIEELAAVADTVVLTDQCSAEDVFVRAAAMLGVYSRAVIPLVDVLIGGQYGSEGKGNIVAHIAPEYDYLIRVGGPNAGHKVYGTPIKTFHHLPSGTERSPAAHLVIGPGAVLRVQSLLDEISRFQVPADRLSIDPAAMIISDEDIEQERQTLEPISSTAQGVGSATARKINDRGSFKDGRSSVCLAKDISELRPFIRTTASVLERAYLDHSRILLEGTQGTSLSIHHGHYPYVTSRDTSVSGCLAEAGISPRRVRKIVMVCRTYPIRVGGNSGPMSQPISTTLIAARSGLSVEEIDRTERTSTTNRPRRIAEFDWLQLRHSTQINGPTDLALTFADYLSSRNRNAVRYEQLTSETIRFIVELEQVAGVPVSLISTGFNWRNIIDRRAW